MSCCNCSFISPSDFPGRVVLDQNIPNEYIEPSIQLTQLTFIKPLLCKDLYEDLCSEVNAGYISPAYQALLCYIREVHVRYAYSDFLFKHSFRTTKESIVRKVANESEFVPFADLITVAKQYKLDAQTYAGELIQFLKDNEETYPLWSSSPCNQCDQRSNNTGGFF